MTLPELILHHRQAAGLSRQDAGEAIGVGRDTIFRWETGERSPTWASLVLMAELLKIDQKTLRELARKENFPNSGK